MQKFFNLAFVPLLISLSSFSLNSCKNKVDSDDNTIVEPKDPTNPNDFDFAIEAEKINGASIGIIDGSNFSFNNNKKNRYFSMAKDCWCNSVFTKGDEYYDNPWTYNKIVKIYVTNDVVWDKVASAYHFNRGSSIEEINSKLSGELYNASCKFKFDGPFEGKQYMKDSCHLIDIVGNYRG